MAFFRFVLQEFLFVGSLLRIFAWGIAERLVLGHAHDFLGSGDALGNEAPAIIAERVEPGAKGGGADFTGGTILQDQLLNLGIHVHPLVNAVPAMVTGVAAFAATNAAKDLQVAWETELFLERARGVRLVLGLAMGQRTRTRRWASTASREEA